MLQKLDAEVIKVRMVGFNNNKLTRMQGGHKLYTQAGMLERLFPDIPVPNLVRSWRAC